MKKILSISFVFIAFLSFGQVQYGGQQDLYLTGQAAQTATVNNIIPATVSSSATDAAGYFSGFVTIICPAGTYTTGAIIFEGANDSPTSTLFQTIPVFNQLTGAPFSAAITLVTTTSIGYTFPINFRYIRVRISTAVSGASASVQAVTRLSKASWSPPFQQVVQPTAANLNVTTTGTVAVSSITTSIVPGTGATNLGKAEDNPAASGDALVGMGALRNDALTINASGTGDYLVPVTDQYGALIIKDQRIQKRTYSTSFTVVPAATATDIFQLIGSATTTVEISKISISGTQTTGGEITFIISKRSTANTGGTSSAATLVPHNSADAAATAVGAIYTANPTTGTPVGDIETIAVPLVAATGSAQVTDRYFGDLAKPIVLNGVAQAIAIRLNGVTVTGGSVNISMTIAEY